MKSNIILIYINRLFFSFNVIFFLLKNFFYRKTLNMYKRLLKLKWLNTKGNSDLEARILFSFKV